METSIKHQPYAPSRLPKADCLGGGDDDCLLVWYWQIFTAHLSAYMRQSLPVKRRLTSHHCLAHWCHSRIQLGSVRYRSDPHRWHYAEPWFLRRLTHSGRKPVNTHSHNYYHHTAFIPRHVPHLVGNSTAIRSIRILVIMAPLNKSPQFQ